MKKQKLKFTELIFTTAIAAVFIFGPASVHADEGIVSSTELSLQVTTRPEAKLSLTQSFIFPLLQGSGPLTSGNNIRTNLIAELTPVSLAGNGQVIWTPIAFLELDAGGRIGSGWNIPGLANGIGLNVPMGGGSPGPITPPRNFEIKGRAFDGLQWSAWAGLAFQFDLAAIIPGDWNHVVFRVHNEFRYFAYTKAGSHEPWVFENNAEHQNGWTLHGTAVLGYQMPLSPVLNFIGLMGEVDFNLYDEPEKGKWGGNLPYWVLSAFFNFSITPQFGTTLIVQMRTRNNYGTTDFENSKDIYYRDRVIVKDGGSQRLLFYRVALMFTYKLR
jgi:hypothetical protein